jgi:cell division protein FtsZ
MPPKPPTAAIAAEPPKTAAPEAPKVEAAEEVPDTAFMSPPLAVTQPEPIVEKPAAEKPVIETQPRLRGVEPQERLPNSQSEEDLLEIPAFLRRQAN